ncbi:MAG: hypothetical protein ACRDLB_10020 [Actinomycetota bacterium]
MSEGQEAVDKELQRLRDQVTSDRKLIRRAADALAQIDRGASFDDEHADVLAALRIRLEGKERARLEDLMAAAGDIGGKKDLGDVLSGADQPEKSDWPVVEEKKRDWPGL